MIKTIKLTVIFSFLFSNCYGQNIDTLVQFANVNEELFWKIVSKNYPFSHSELDTYKEDINFYYLSGNENINWTPELIRKYEFSLSKTYELQRNKGVQWNESLIRVFLGREWLNWSELYFNRHLTISKELFDKEKRNFITQKFLVNETRDSLTFYYNHEYFTKKRVFQNYLKKWYKASDTLNLIHYDAMKQYFDKEISSVPLDTIVKYKEEFRSYEFTEFAVINWNWNVFLSLYSHLDKGTIPDNESIFNILFKERLDAEFLSTLSKQLNTKERLYRLTGGADKYGDAPSINVKKPDSRYFIKLGDEFEFIRSFPDSLNNYSFEIDHSSEGPKRFLDIMFLYNDSGFPSYICSKATKYILENYNLPNHKFYPIKVVLNSNWYGNDTSNYFLFVTDNSSLLDNIEFKSTKIRDSRELLQAFDSIQIDSLKINSLSQFKNFIDSRYHYKNYKYKKLAQLHLNKSFDIFTINGDNLYISKRLKNALLIANVSGLKVFKTYSLEWVFQKSENRNISTNNAEEYKIDLVNIEQKTTKLFDEAKGRQKHLATNWDNVSKLYGKSKNNSLDSLELKLKEMEIQWDVIIPEEYRKYIITNQNPNLGREFREYEFLPINRMEQVGREWYKNIPQTYKGVLIAENGLGDYLGFLLEENSNYQLSNTIYKFEHEIGELIKSIKLE